MSIAQLISKKAIRFSGNPKEYDPIIKAIGDARVIMIGEASHGTHEFYKERAEITKRLIVEKGVSFVAVEADWPDAYKINRYVRGMDGPEEALSLFKRFPRWMWRNDVVFDFIQWLRSYNDGLQDSKRKVGFYGLDLYSLFESIHEVVDYLTKIDPKLAKEAKEYYACFERFHGDTQAYGYAATLGAKTCEVEVSRILQRLLKQSMEKMSGKFVDGEELFYAQENAKVVKDAEEYYRNMFSKDTWNLRDSHMVNILNDLLVHYQEHFGQDNSKAVVWAHNSHLGDAGATEDRGKTNIGEISRNRFGLENTFNIGFSTYHGTVTAASNWDEPAQRKKVRPGLSGSYEKLLHEAGIPFYGLLFRSNSKEIIPDKELLKSIPDDRLERAIGVIYRPDTERWSHYFHANLPQQFDAMIHIEKTTALKPLDLESYLDESEPDTYPYAV